MKGPWVTAQFDGECSGCPTEIVAGQTLIRADGYGGWEAECCDDGEDEE